jgi:glutaredoxin
VDLLFQNSLPYTFVAVSSAMDAAVPPHPSGHVTVPVVFHNGVFVGGYTDLLHHVRKSS